MPRARLSTTWHRPKPPDIRLKQDACFEHHPRLGRIGEIGAERETGCRAAGPDMRELGSREIDLILISWGYRDRPCVAARAIEEIGRTAGKVAGRSNVFEANGQAEARQERVLAKGIICQYRASVCRGRGGSPDR